MLSCRFRRISQLYSQGVRPLARDMLELQNWNWLYNATDKLTKGWLTHGARLLQQVIASAKSSEEAMQVMISTAVLDALCVLASSSSCAMHRTHALPTPVKQLCKHHLVLLPFCLCNMIL